MTSPSTFDLYAHDEILPYDEEREGIIRDGGFIITIDEHGNAVCGGGPLPKPILSDWPTPINDTDDAIQALGGLPLPKPILSDWPVVINDPAPLVIEGFDDGGFVITLDEHGNAVCGGGPLPKPILSDWPTPINDTDDAIQAPGGLPLPKPILSDWPTSIDGVDTGKISFKDVLDTGFIVTVDKDGNAVCGPAFDGLQKALNDFTGTAESRFVQEAAAPAQSLAAFATATTNTTDDLLVAASTAA